MLPIRIRRPITISALLAAAGVLAFAGLAGHDAAVICAGHGPCLAGLEFPAPGPAVDRYAASVRPLRGQVLSTRGKPVAGASLMLADGVSTQSAKTGANGTFVFARHPAGESAIRVQAAGFAELALENVLCTDPLMLGLAEPQRIRGVVVDGDTGRAVAARVTVAPADARPWRLEVGRDGVFALDVSTRGGTVYAVAPGFELYRREFRRAEELRIELRRTDRAQELDAAGYPRGPSPALLGSTLTPPQESRGAEGFEVEFELEFDPLRAPEGPVVLRFVRPGASAFAIQVVAPEQFEKSGLVRLTVPAGRSYMHASDATSRSRNHFITCDTACRYSQPVVLKPLRTVTGCITGPDGRRLGGADVVTHDYAIIPYPPIAFTDARGCFRIAFCCDWTSLTARHEDCRGSASNRDAARHLHLRLVRGR